jgi:dihydrofolate reductase
MGQTLMAGSANSAGLLLGWRTYQDFFGFWPHQTDNPYSEVLNQARKYVVSRTLTEPLPWQNSTLLRGDLGPAVSVLKTEVDGTLVVLGSGELVRSLTALGLVDRYLIVINPLLLGQGRRLFAETGPRHDLRLVDSVVTTTGAIIATYVGGEGSAA